MLMPIDEMRNWHVDHEQGFACGKFHEGEKIGLRSTWIEGQLNSNFGLADDKGKHDVGGMRNFPLM